MRGAPQVGFSATIRKMRSRNSVLTHFLPVRIRCRESHVQYSLKPSRCQRTTVSGWTRINACFHLGQNRCNITQKHLSDAANRGRGVFRFKTESCCRRARFSKSRSRRERKNRAGKTARSLRRRSMLSVLHVDRQTGCVCYRFDLKVDRYFGEAQLVLAEGKSQFWRTSTKIGQTFLPSV